MILDSLERYLYKPAPPVKLAALLVLLVCAVASGQVGAADLFRTPLIQGPQRTETGPYFGVSGQVTRFGTLQNSGEQVENRFDQQLNTSVTEVTLGYNFTRSFGLELDAPFIYREYKRLNRFEVEDDQTAGVGDISLVANWTAIRLGEGEKFFGLKFSAGVKLPTGDSDRLKEEAEEPGEITALVETVPAGFNRIPNIVIMPRLVPGSTIVVFAPVVRGYRLEFRPPIFEEAVVGEQPRNTIRGKDLAIGSGSIDGILAANLYTRWYRFFVAGDARYTFRTEGAFDYQYADIFQWSGGPGLYVVEGRDASVAIQLICSGESKGEDEFRGRERSDTALTAIFLGPSITATWRDRFSAQIGAELPVHVDNSGLQAVPYFRIQASAAWQF